MVGDESVWSVRQARSSASRAWILLNAGLIGLCLGVGTAAALGSSIPSWVAVAGVVGVATGGGVCFGLLALARRYIPGGTRHRTPARPQRDRPSAAVDDGRPEGEL